MATTAANAAPTSGAKRKPEVFLIIDSDDETTPALANILKKSKSIKIKTEPPAPAFNVDTDDDTEDDEVEVISGGKAAPSPAGDDADVVIQPAKSVSTAPTFGPGQCTAVLSLFACDLEGAPR